MKLLELSSKAASVGNTSTEITANALTAALKAFNLPASQAGAVMDMMVKTVSTGKTEFEDYAKIIGKVSINAQQAGVSFGEANAAFATLTNVMPSSKQAADSLNALLQTSSRFDLLANRAEAMGVAFDTDAYKAMNLQQRMQYLMQITDGNSEAMTKLLGRQNARAAVTALATGNFAGYNDALQKVTNSQEALDKAFEKTSSGFNASVARLKASFDVVLITLGNQLLPIATSLVNAITPIVTSFSQISSASSPLAPILTNISGMFRVMASNWTDLAARSQPLVLAFQHFGQFLAGSMPGFVSQFLQIMAEVNLVIVDIATAISQWAVPGFAILQQIFQSAQTAAQPIINAIQGQLTPALHNLITAIAPVITGILQWIASSGIIPAIMTGISIAIQIVIGVVSFLVNILAALITFFTQNMIGIALFRAVLILLAVVIGVIAIVILSTVIPAFIAWVAGAIAVGIANIIAFGPIILVVLAIIAVIAIVILIFMNWGAICDWLAGVWSAFVSWFMGAMSATGAFFSGLWSSIVSWFAGLWSGFVSWFMGAMGAIGSFFSGLWSGTISGIQSAWASVVSFFQGLVAGIIGIFQRGVQMVVGAFAWLYQHNYYFQMLVDTIRAVIAAIVVWLTTTWRNVTTAVVAAWTLLVSGATSAWTAVKTAITTAVSAVASWLQSAWQATVSFLTGLWRGTVSVATSVWNSVKQAVTVAVTATVSWLQGIWANVVSWLSSTWNNLVKGATDMWTKIVDVFAKAWDSVSRPLTQIYDNLVKWASDLVTGAMDWGKNLIQGFIDGITSMLGAVGEAAGNVVAEIGKFLGFHSPSEAGPGAQADEWAPAFIDMYAKGLTEGAKQIQVASQQLMISMQTTFQQGFAQLNVIVQQGVVSMTQTLSLSWTQMIAATTVGMQQVQLAMQQGWTQVALSVTTSLQLVTTAFTTWWTQTLLLFTQSYQKLILLFQVSWQQILNNLTLILQQLEKLIQDSFKRILDYLTKQQALIEKAITTPFTNAAKQVDQIMKQMASSVSTAVDGMISKLQSVADAAAQAKAAAASVPSVPSGSSANNFASGVENFTGGLAYVHEKEVLVNLAPGTSVVPANRVSFGGSGKGAGANITNYITITVPRGRTDVEDIADEVSRVLAREFKGLLSTISTGGTSI